MRRYVIVFALLTLALPFASASLGFGFDEYKLLMKGFLQGITVEDKYLDHLLSCLNDRKTLEVRFVELMDKIDKLDFTNLPLTAELFVELFDVLTTSIIEIDLCAEENEAYDRLFQKIYHLMSTTIFKRLMLNFISNPQQIFKDMQDAIDNYLLRKFQLLGNDLGDIMHMVVIYRASSEEQTTLQDYTSLLKGLLRSLHLEADSLLKCVDKVPDVVSELFAAVRAIKGLDVRHVSELAESLGQTLAAVKKVLAGLSPCADEAARKVAARLQALDTRRLPLLVAPSFVKVAARIMAAKIALDKKDLEAFGSSVGSTVQLISGADS